jgi:predicted peptidase
MRSLLLAMTVILCGCGRAPEPNEDDGGSTDAGDAADASTSFDAGAADAGESDAGPPDAGESDAGAPDAGIADAGPVDAGPASARQVQRRLGSTDAGNGYYEYLPPRYGDGVARPLIIFWHGVGEDGNGGTELSRVLLHGPPKLIAGDAWPDDRPFVVLSPQHAGTGCPSADEVHAFITFAASTYAVDPHRLYLTGLSCGAIGSWRYLTQHLDAQVAAAALIAGDPGNAWFIHGCELGRVALWDFHGTDDFDVLIGPDRDTMTLLIACPMPPRKDARFTEYPGVGHDSWTRTYDLSAGHDLYTWLLAQTKP